MLMDKWYGRLSGGQRIRLYATLFGILLIMATGFMVNRSDNQEKKVSVDVEMSLMEIAPALGVTPKALARELGLPLDTPKKSPLRALGIQPEALEQTTAHLLSHHGSTIKYFVFAALVFGGLMYLVDLGRPAGLPVSQRRKWYPRTIYIAFLTVSVCVAGFILGKSPNPMEGVVKVFKSMVGLYPDPWIKLGALLFFMVLAIVGNKLICGWACPFGALQELIYSIPIWEKLKRHKPPFWITNTIRGVFFIIVLMVLFGIAGGKKGMVLYHYINPFNLFDLSFESVGIPVTIAVAVVLAFILYRPFCQFICPFGLVSWVFEAISVYKIRIDRKTCTNCGACVRACPSVAAKGRVEGKRLPADCFSCARCLNVCAVDAIGYKSAFKDKKFHH